MGQLSQLVGWRLGDILAAVQFLRKLGQRSVGASGVVTEAFHLDGGGRDRPIRVHSGDNLGPWCGQFAQTLKRIAHQARDYPVARELVGVIWPTPVRSATRERFAVNRWTSVAAVTGERTQADHLAKDRPIAGLTLAGRFYCCARRASSSCTRRRPRSLCPVCRAAAFE